MQGKDLLIKDRTTFLYAMSNVLQTKCPYAISTYIYLLDQAEEFDPSQRQIANILNISRSSVIKALTTLEEHGMIKRLTQGHRRLQSTYTFIIPVKRNP
jgi:predicted transcriptional regulator